MKKILYVIVLLACFACEKEELTTIPIEKSL